MNLFSPIAYPASIIFTSKQAGPLWPACFENICISLFLPKAKVHFTTLIDLNVHGLDVAGIELVLFTGGHVRPGHFVNLSEDILVRDYAARQDIESGMADMSQDFRTRGGEIYLRKEQA